MMSTLPIDRTYYCSRNWVERKKEKKKWICWGCIDSAECAMSYFTYISPHLLNCTLQNRHRFPPRPPAVIVGDGVVGSC
jgi:hypothetical protein